MARSDAARDRQGGQNGKSRSSKREVGTYGKTRPREDKSVRRARGRQTDGRYRAAVAEVAQHEAKLRELEGRLADQPHTPYRPTLVTEENVAEFVARSTQESGVPLKVQDPEALKKVATLMAVPKPPALPAGSMKEAWELLTQGYHVDRVAARTGIPAARLRHLVAPDGYLA